MFCGAVAEFLNMKNNNNMSDLEKITHRTEELVICDVKKCEVRGDYWKCYMGNYIKCPTFLNSKIYKPRDSK